MVSATNSPKSSDSSGLWKCSCGSVVVCRLSVRTALSLSVYSPSTPDAVIAPACSCPGWLAFPSRAH